jgi:dienelactone hydrolase
MNEQIVSHKADRKSKIWLAVAGLIILVAGAWLAMSVRTAGGISVQDIRFKGADGTQMSALLYVPPGASADKKAPGILAVHGYINSRETQDGFSIEFARRGYVVLALDQTGHGYSGGAALSNDFGGPDALRYLRALPMVDTSQIGLEGHSMGGWTVLAAAAAMPNDYRAMVLEGSSTGAPFAKDGTPNWPRNLAVVFSKYDEFSALMWGTNRAADVAQSKKLQAVFGTKQAVVAGQIYGSPAQATARALYQPAVTHPGDHFSPAAIGHATNWFAKTLTGGTPKPASDQIWYWKELGTGIGLIGFIMLLLGVFDAALRLNYFADLRHIPISAVPVRDAKWRRNFIATSFVAALLFFPVFSGLYLLSLAAPVMPQVVTTQVAFWALLGAAASLWRGRKDQAAEHLPTLSWTKSAAIAAITLIAGYLALLFIDQVFHTDLRFWVIALKLPAAHHWIIAAVYVIPITAAFMVTLKSLMRTLTVQGDGPIRRYMSAIGAFSLGFIVLLTLIYGILFTAGTLITAFDPLSTIIALQFVPLLVAIAIIAIFTWHRTASHRPGALIIGALITLYVVAGTATQLPM